MKHSPSGSSSRTGQPRTRRLFAATPGTSRNAGDTIPLGSKRALRVLDKRVDNWTMTLCRCR